MKTHTHTHTRTSKEKVRRPDPTSHLVTSAAAAAAAGAGAAAVFFLFLFSFTRPPLFFAVIVVVVAQGSRRTQFPFWFLWRSVALRVGVVVSCRCVHRTRPPLLPLVTAEAAATAAAAAAAAAALIRRVPGSLFRLIIGYGRRCFLFFPVFFIPFFCCVCVVVCVCVCVCVWNTHAFSWVSTYGGISLRNRHRPPNNKSEHAAARFESPVGQRPAGWCRDRSIASPTTDKNTVEKPSNDGLQISKIGSKLDVFFFNENKSVLTGNVAFWTK